MRREEVCCFFIIALYVSSPTKVGKVLVFVHRVRLSTTHTRVSSVGLYFSGHFVIFFFLGVKRRRLQCDGIAAPVLLSFLLGRGLLYCTFGRFVGTHLDEVCLLSDIADTVNSASSSSSSTHAKREINISYNSATVFLIVWVFPLPLLRFRLFLRGRYDHWPTKAGGADEYGSGLSTMYNSYPPVDVFADDLN